MSNYYSTYTDSSTSLWGIWTNTVSTTTSAINNSTQYIWANWLSGGTSATSTNAIITANNIWGSWVEPVVRKLTVAEVAANYKYKEEARIRREAEEVERREAEAKAEALLLEYLSEQEAEEYVKKGYFHVLSSDGVSKYRIRNGRANNVEKINEQGEVTKIFCSHPYENVPNQDNMLTQRFALLHMEEEFEKKMANVRNVRAG